MPLVVNNPFGMNHADFVEATAAERIGQRIRSIRKARGMSQTELGEKIGLSADRVQKYENGVRKPKTEMLKLIAKALGVEADALIDPIVSNWIGAMFALFEMEELYDIQPVKDGMRTYLQFGNGITEGLTGYIQQWYDVKQRTNIEPDDPDDVRKKKMEEYNNWKWSYPQPLVDETEKILKKARIERRIEELQRELKNLEE